MKQQCIKMRNYIKSSGNDFCCENCCKLIEKNNNPVLTCSFISWWKSRREHKSTQEDWRAHRHIHQSTNEPREAFKGWELQIKRGCTKSSTDHLKSARSKSNYVQQPGQEQGGSILEEDKRGKWNSKCKEGTAGSPKGCSDCILWPWQVNYLSL